MLQEFKAITFDCYGTLIDWERGILDQLRPWLDRTFGIGKGALLHAACSVFHDIVPASAMGITTAWINRRNDIGALGQAARADYEVADMAGLVALHKK